MNRGWAWRWGLCKESEVGARGGVKAREKEATELAGIGRRRKREGERRKAKTVGGGVCGIGI